MIDLKKHIDETDFISQRFIARNKFKTILVFDEFSGIESAWLADFLNFEINHRLIGYTYEKREVRTTTHVISTRDEILKFVNLNNLHHSLLTTDEEDFAIYFSQYRDVFIYAGKPNFLRGVYPIKLETVKFQFFSNVKHKQEAEMASFLMNNSHSPSREMSRLEQHNREEFERLSGLWSKYENSAFEDEKRPN